MNDNEAEVLGRRWLAAGGGWRDGMLCRCERPHDRWRFIGGAPWPTDRPTWWPDLRDAATRGAALEVVRERWGAPALHVSPVVATKPNGIPTAIVTSWRYYVNDPEDHFDAAPTEAEALVAALEAR